MNTTVVLSTYNGEKYIATLLESLMHQTVAADEVLICDDCSSDQTVKIIKKFILDNKLYNWNLNINTKNVGWKYNFYKLITCAKGDFIFPCDQDDIWHFDKIEKCLETMNKYKEILLLCSDFNIFYMDGSTGFPKAKISKISDSDEIEKIKTKRAIQVVDRPGCTYCIRKELLPIMKKLWFQDCPHDALAWRAAMLCDGLYIYHKKLIDFRRHSANASDKKRNNLQERIDLANYYINVFTKLISYSKRKNYTDKYLNNCIHYQNKRKEYLQNTSLLQWLRNIKCIFYSPSIRTYIADGIAIYKSIELNKMIKQ